MTIKDTLAKLDTALGVKTPTVVKMTKAQFEEHVTSELTKAKAEAGPEDEKDAEKKAKGAEKAKKRLEFLRATAKLLVAKSSWEGGNPGAIPIPVYEEGFEPPTYMPTEEGGDMLGGKGTQADGTTFAAAGGASGYGDANGTSGGASGTTVPLSAVGTQSDESFAAPGGAQGFGKNLTKAFADLTEVMKGLTPAAPPAATTAPVAKSNGHVDDPSVWPKDLANKDFLKEGIAKRDGEWGTDPWAAVK